MKCLGTGIGAGNVKMGCILGLRVSPKHRRMGIGSKLIKSVEDWAVRNGAQYICLATEENNVASINLCVLKFNYVKLSSLSILIEPVGVCAKKNPPHSVNIEKLSVEQAISLYKDRLGGKKFFPIDIDAILKEQLSLGTWVSYFKEEQWGGLHCQGEEGEFMSKLPSSWAVLSMWKTYESYKLQVKGAPLVRFFHATFGHISSKVLPCLRPHPSYELLSGSFGFLFLYGLHGEGERMGELMKSLWCFASNSAEKVRDCKAIVTELGVGDPLREQVPCGSSASSISDLWFIKRVSGTANEDNDWAISQPMSTVFVDPRDF